MKKGKEGRVDEESKARSGEGKPDEPHRVRLPGFLIPEEVGLGDVIKKATYVMGIKP